MDRWINWNLLSVWICLVEQSSSALSFIWTGSHRAFLWVASNFLLNYKSERPQFALLHIIQYFIRHEFWWSTTFTYGRYTLAEAIATIYHIERNRIVRMQNSLSDSVLQMLIYHTYVLLKQVVQRRDDDSPHYS